MHILITGAGGLLGHKLMDLLAEKPDIRVTATARQSISTPSSIGFRIMDITREQEVQEVISETRPDVIIHAAAMTQVDECELNPEACRHVNVTGTENVAKAAENVGAFLLHVSTDFIFDGTQRLLQEDAMPGPVNYYGQTKWEAEKVVQALPTPWAIARTILVYGYCAQLNRSNIVLWVKESLEQGRQIQVVDDQWRTPTLAEDLAEACLRIVAQKATGIFHISGEELLTPFEMAQKVAAYFGLAASNIQRANAATFRQAAQRPAKTGFSIQKAKQILGFQPHSFEEGIALLASQLTRDTNG
jgi:dTDP-4-dehydrorhamnose reductase